MSKYIAVDWAPIEPRRRHRWLRAIVGAIAVGVFTFLFLVVGFVILNVLIAGRPPIAP